MAENGADKHGKRGVRGPPQEPGFYTVDSTIKPAAKLPYANQ